MIMMIMMIMMITMIMMTAPCPSPFRTFIDLGIAIFPLQKGLTRDTKDFKGKYVLRERQIQTVKFQKISVTKKQSYHRVQSNMVLSFLCALAALIVAFWDQTCNPQMSTW